MALSKRQKLKDEIRSLEIIKKRMKSAVTVLANEVIRSELEYKTRQSSRVRHAEDLQDTLDRINSEIEIQTRRAHAVRLLTQEAMQALMALQDCHTSWRFRVRETVGFTEEGVM